MVIFFQNLVNALQWGSFYALIALGYSMVYTMIAVMLTLSLNVINGYMGEFSCSHPDEPSPAETESGRGGVTCRSWRSIKCPTTSADCGPFRTTTLKSSSVRSGG
jgi:hypothetical protein